jgi:hypothetical protein
MALIYRLDRTDEQGKEVVQGAYPFRAQKAKAVSVLMDALRTDQAS